ncbi:unnamed protein product, partial [Didymodactylos carnosus]
MFGSRFWNRYRGSGSRIRTEPERTAVP